MMLNTQNVIIFDSPDGTGKTEIASALSLELGIPYFKMNTEHENWRKGKFKTALEFDQTYISEFIKQTGCSAIIDRAYPAEWVYSSVYERTTNLSVLRNVDKIFSKMNTRIIIPVRSCYENCRSDELVNSKMLPKLHKKYMEFREWTRCSTITIYVDAYDNNLKLEIEAIKIALSMPAPINVILDG